MYASEDGGPATQIATGSPWTPAFVGQTPTGTSFPLLTDGNFEISGSIFDYLYNSGAALEMSVNVYNSDTAGSHTLTLSLEDTNFALASPNGTSLSIDSYLQEGPPNVLFTPGFGKFQGQFSTSFQTLAGGLPVQSINYQSNTHFSDISSPGAMASVSNFDAKNKAIIFLNADSTINLIGVSSFYPGGNFSPTPLPSTLVMSSILFGMFGMVWSYKRLRRTTATT